MNLLTEENAAFVNWVQLCDIDDCDKCNLQKQRVEIAKTLYYASIAGLTEASYALLEMGADADAQGGKYANALQTASIGSHEVIAKLLIEKWADVNAQGGACGNALPPPSLLPPSITPSLPPPSLRTLHSSTYSGMTLDGLQRTPNGFLLFIHYFF